MKKRLSFLGVFPLLGLASCLGLRETDARFSPGATGFNQRVADDIRHFDDSLARAARRQRLRQHLRRPMWP